MLRIPPLTRNQSAVAAAAALTLAYVAIAQFTFLRPGWGEPRETARFADYDSAPEFERAIAEESHFYHFASPSDIPADLIWEDGLSHPEIGSPSALKGGTLTLGIRQYPPTFRHVGPESNNSFRSEFYDNIDVGLVGLHPETGAIIPGVARRWAVTEDRRTVFFELDPEATFSDGMPITTHDILMTFYINRSDYAQAPYSKQYYNEEFESITIYDDHTFSITLPEAKPLTPFFAAIVPLPAHFYREFGPDFPERYQWRVRPNTGAYTIDPEASRRGQIVVLRRVEDWWARDRQYFRNRFNVDTIRYRMARDDAKDYELFRNGLIDVMGPAVNFPEYWYERLEIPPVFAGYIEKATFFNNYPRIPRGLYINCSRPLLNDVHIRRGLQHATNFEKVIEVELRGDSARLNTFADGYGAFSEPTIRAREFSPEKAAEEFAKAGFTRRGRDGIFINEQGRRLSFTISAPISPLIRKILLRIKEEAAKAGVEFLIEETDGTANYKKVMEKQHEICITGWGVTPPYPRYYQHFHSSNAFEEDGTTPKVQTNNITMSSDPRLDEHSWAIRRASDEETIIHHAHAIEHVIHDLAPWIPGYDRDRYRSAHWRWVRFPEDSFNVAMSYEPLEAHVHWVDPQMMEETLSAQRAGETFPEVDAIFRNHDTPAHEAP
jgi:microcin C transport system substrate-binding protein